MTKTKAQKISDNSPSTFSGVGTSPNLSEKYTRRMYRGLVPMSPKTAPRALSTKTEVLAVGL